MSDVCSRRRLVKLAFVTGVCGNLPGSLEKSNDIDSHGDFRPGDPFVFHAGFLDVESESGDASAPGDSFRSGLLQLGVGLDKAGTLENAEQFEAFYGGLVALEAEANMTVVEGVLLEKKEVAERGYSAPERNKKILEDLLDELAAKGEEETKNWIKKEAKEWSEKVKQRSGAKRYPDQASEQKKTSEWKKWAEDEQLEYNRISPEAKEKAKRSEAKRQKELEGEKQRLQEIKKQREEEEQQRLEKEEQRKRQQEEEERLQRLEKEEQRKRKQEEEERLQQLREDKQRKEVIVQQLLQQTGGVVAACAFFFVFFLVVFKACGNSYSRRSRGNEVRKGVGRGM